MREILADIVSWFFWRKGFLSCSLIIKQVLHDSESAFLPALGHYLAWASSWMEEVWPLWSNPSWPQLLPVSCGWVVKLPWLQNSSGFRDWTCYCKWHRRKVYQNVKRSNWHSENWAVPFGHFANCWRVSKVGWKIKRRTISKEDIKRVINKGALSPKRTSKEWFPKLCQGETPPLFRQRQVYKTLVRWSLNCIIPVSYHLSIAVK